MNFVTNIHNDKRISLYRLRLLENVIQVEIRICEIERLLHVLENTIIEIFIKLNNTGIIGQTKAHLLFLPEQYQQMRENKKLLFVFFTSLDQLVEGDDQLLAIDSVRDHQSSYNRREGSFPKKTILLEEHSVDRSLQNRKTIILLPLRPLLDLANSRHDSNLSLILLHIQFLISLKALLEVIGHAKQGKIFVVLFNHEFLEHFLLALHGLLEGLHCPLTHYIPPNHIERAIVIS